jgi:hypothetical protein
VSRVIKASVWRMPKRVEACNCTECPLDTKLGCSSSQTMFDAWPGWFVFNWIPRRIVCAIIGHRKGFKYGGAWYPSKGRCHRCWSRRVMAELNLVTGDARVMER